MPFHTLRFWLFLLIVFPPFALVRRDRRWAVLLVASVIFFAALEMPALVLALGVVTLASYGAGRGVESASAPWLRRLFLWSGIVVNVLVLAAFKYLPAIVGPPADGSQPVLALIGVSYFTFQGISSVADVYVGRGPAERHLGYFALYMAFFPKLLQGPIERASDLIPQLRQNLRIDPDGCRVGALLIAWGLFKKTVVADRAAPLVEAVYGSVDAYTGIPLAMATYLYAVQLYCDFSGYTDMALGVARCFGIRLTQNFENPYAARSIADFWRRWHISFSRWILEYLFKPLQFVLRNLGTAGSALALVITFLVSGVWHGAGWTFVVWGLIHGLYMSVSLYLRPVRKFMRDRGWRNDRPAVAACQMLVTLHLVLFSWIFFRANSVPDALHIVSSLGFGTEGARSLLFLNGVFNAMVLALGAAVVVLVDMVGRPRIDGLLARPMWVRWPAYYALATSILVFGVEGTGTFIYFQF